MLHWSTFFRYSPAAALLLTLFSTALAGQRYEADGEQALANLSREQAIKLAREEAMGEILAQSGIDVSAQTVVVNQRMASYQLLATRNARVVNFRCTDADLEPSGRTAGGRSIYVQKTRCSGEVQRFGEAAPALETTLELASNGNCKDLPASATSGDGSPLFTVRANEPFCLRLRAAAESWVGVYGLFEQDGETRVVRVFPQPGSKYPYLHLEANVLPELTPLAGAPLSGESEAMEAIIVVASRQPALLDHLAGERGIGESVAGTVDASVSTSVFDQQLGKLDLRQVNLKLLPYRILGR